MKKKEKKRKKKRERNVEREFLSLHPCLSQLKKKKKSKLWILGRKEGVCFLWI